MMFLDPASAPALPDETTSNPLEARSLELLEWPRLLGHLAKRCLSDYGQRLWKQQAFLSNAGEAHQHLQEVALLQGLLVRFGLPSWETHLPLIQQTLQRVGKGGRLGLKEACQVLQALLGMRKLIGYIGNNLPACVADKTQLASVFEWLFSITLPAALMEQLQQWLDVEREAFKPEASPLLTELSQRYKGQQRCQQQEADAFLQNPGILACLQSPQYVVREGRLALPVKAAHKNQIKGRLLGSSSSGGTVFIEPRALEESYQRLMETEAEIKTEEQRLLGVLSLAMEPETEALLTYTQAFAQLDRRLAAAQLARELDATVPLLLGLEHHKATSPGFHWHQARHPLLVLEPPPGGVVANTLTMGKKPGSNQETPPINTLIITGPNTGGKTVLLKLVGLLALMLRCGLPVPVAEGSWCSWLSPVFAELGDAQDLTQNLSTFSGHLLRLNAVLQSPPGTWQNGLLLVDEIVAGTDPVEGGALAKALLAEFYTSGALTLVTTHLGSLKEEAHKQPGYQNASAIFDLETLAPTYRVVQGVPGSSNALAIARRLGLPEGVVQDAEQLLSQGERQTGSLLSDLETRLYQSEENWQAANRLKTQLEAERKALAAEREALRQGKQRELEQFRTGLRRRVMGLDKQLKTLRKQVRATESDLETSTSLQLSSSRLKHVEQTLETAFGETEEGLQAEAMAATELLPVVVFEVGQTVISERLGGGRAVVEQVLGKGKKQKYAIRAGSMQLTVEASDLTAIDTSTTQEVLARKRSAHKRLQSSLKMMAHNAKGLASSSATTASVLGQSPSGKRFKPELDVRGQRLEEALHAVELFMDEAQFHNVETVRIIHGLGTGVLKKAIRSWLAKQSYVERHYPEQAIYGGDGNTVVELKQ